MVDQINDKASLIHFIRQRSSQKNDQAEINNLKYIQRLNASMSVFCGSQCLKDFNDNTVLPNESACLTNCSRRFYDSVEIAEQVFKASLN